MQYSNKDYEFLGKQVAAGRYVQRTTFALALVVALLLGALLGRYVFPDLPQGAVPGETKRPIGKDSADSPFSFDNQVADSIKQHEEQVRQTPENAEAWEHLGNLYYDAHQTEKAITAYNKALALKPDNTSVLVDCGVMYREAKQFDKALEYFQRALQINAKHEHALFNSGVVLLFDLKRKEEAMKVWQSLVQINPNAKAPSGELVSKLIQDMS